MVSHDVPTGDNELAAGLNAPGDGGLAAAGSLSRGVDRLCEDVHLPETHLMDQINHIRDRLREPLRIALAGRVSSGKSTLANALLSTKVAPVGAKETTHLIAHFVHGGNESMTVQLRSGLRHQSFLSVDGQIPDDVGVPLQDVERLEVRLPYAPLLRQASLIDTPGISSIRAEYSTVTEEALFRRTTEDSRAAIADADALLFLLGGGGSKDEEEALAAFADLTRGSAATSVNAIGVLGKVDGLGPTDPVEAMEAAWKKARRLQSEPYVRPRLCAVIPVVGLIAETITTGSFSLDDERALRQLATETSDGWTMRNVEDLYELSSAVPAATRRGLVDRLGLFGIRLARNALLRGVEPADLAGVLLRECGFDTLLDGIRSSFTSRGDLLKADAHLAHLERLTYQSSAPAAHTLRRRIEEMRLSPEMHRVQELWALAQLAQANVELSEDMEERLFTLTSGNALHQRLGLSSDATREDVRSAARQGAGACHAFAMAPATNTAAREVAEIMRVSYTMMLRAELQ